ncbi:MAG: hypothetical protein R3215_11095 [Halomonas sp.]|nr:hypothetical protein [Halomonas sp.]
MQYTININQAKAKEWGLNSQQAMLFAFVYECPSWCNAVTQDGVVFFALSKLKIIEELPLLTDKPDTAYRMLKALRDKGLIELSSTNAITLVRLTDKARTWNQKEDGSEKYPGRVGKKSDLGRINLRDGSEKNPTNHDTNNQGTKNQSSQGAYPEDFEEAWYAYPSREGSNPKNHAYRAWKTRVEEGHSVADILAGIHRYASFCKAKGSTGTGFVMQAKRFFGTSHEFLNDWAVATEPPKKFGRHTGLQAPSTDGLTQREDGTYEF